MFHQIHVDHERRNNYIGERRTIMVDVRASRALLSREKSWRKQDGIEERTFRTGLRKY